MPASINGHTAIAPDRHELCAECGNPAWFKRIRLIGNFMRHEYRCQAHAASVEPLKASEVGRSNITSFKRVKVG
jgi:hypothetical protein